MIWYARKNRKLQTGWRNNGLGDPSLGTKNHYWDYGPEKEGFFILFYVVLLHALIKNPDPARSLKHHQRLQEALLQNTSKDSLCCFIGFMHVLRTLNSIQVWNSRGLFTLIEFYAFVLGIRWRSSSALILANSYKMVALMVISSNAICTKRANINFKISPLRGSCQQQHWSVIRLLAHARNCMRLEGLPETPHSESRCLAQRLT